MSIDTLLDAPMNVKNMTTEFQPHTEGLGTPAQEIGIDQSVWDKVIDDFLTATQKYFSDSEIDIGEFLEEKVSLFSDTFIFLDEEQKKKINPHLQSILSFQVHQAINNAVEDDPINKYWDPEWIHHGLNATLSYQILFPEKIIPDDEQNINSIIEFAEEYLDGVDTWRFQAGAVDAERLLSTIFRYKLLRPDGNATKHFKRVWPVLLKKLHLDIDRHEEVFVIVNSLAQIKIIDREAFVDIKWFDNESLQNLREYTQKVMDKGPNFPYNRNLTDHALPFLILNGNITLGEKGIELNRSKQNSEIDTPEIPPLPTTRRFGK